MRAQSGGTPSDFEDFVEPLGPRIELRPHLEWIASVDAAKIFDGQRLFFRLDFQVNVAVCAPPERAKQATNTAVASEAVVIANKLLTVHFIAVPLGAALSALNEQRFGVAELDDCALPATYDQLRESGC